MGFYINPPNMTKEAWLKQFGTLTNNPHRVRLERDADGKVKVLVLLIDNGMFTAAAICYSDDEYERFIEGMDGRSFTQWFVPYEKLTPYLFGKKIEGMEDQADD